MNSFLRKLNEVDNNLFDDSLENKENFTSFNKDTFILEKPAKSVAYSIDFTPKKKNSNNVSKSNYNLNSTVTIKKCQKLNSTYIKSSQKKPKKTNSKLKINLASMNYLNCVNDKILEVKNEIIKGKNNIYFSDDFKYLEIFESNLNLLLKHLSVKIEKNSEIEKIKINNVVKIQSFWRKCLAKKRLNLLKEAKVLKNQELSYKLKQSVELEYNNLINKSCIVIQRTWKTYKFRQSIRSKLKSNKQIKHEKSCIVIQTAWRKYLFRKSILKLFEEIKLKKRSNSAYVIQKAWKNYYLRKYLGKNLSKHELEKIKSALIIQRNWRKYQLRKNLQNLILKRKKTIEIQSRNAILIQRVWRGYLTRKRNFLENKQTITLIKRISQANRNAESKQTVGKITEVAIQKLIKYKYHETALQHLIKLESTTSMSDESCIQVASPEIVKVLIKVISGCNRSHPCLEIIKKSISIILNLVKCNKTLNIIFKTSLLMECVMDTLTKHYKNTAIFLKCMTLLYILLQNENFPNSIAFRFKIKRLLNKVSQDHELSKKNQNKIFYFDPCWSTKKHPRLQFCTIKQALSAFYNYF